MARLQRLKKAATIAGTFACALLIGYVMQYGDADASRFSDLAAVEQRNVLPAQIDPSPLQRVTSLQPKVPAPVQLSTNLFDAVRVEADSVKLTALVAEAAQTALDEATAIVEDEDARNKPTCGVKLDAALSDEAMIVLSVQSPCRPEAPFQISHDGLLVSELTDMAGQARVEVPALTQNVSVSVVFADGAAQTLTATVPEAANYNRVVLQWEGLQAEYIQLAGNTGGQAGSLRRLGAETGGFNQFAEVFTFPASFSVADGLRNLTMLAEVSDTTCGQEFAAQTFRVEPDLNPEFKDIRITLPGCEHVGTFLELKKVLGGQTLLQ